MDEKEIDGAIEMIASLESELRGFDGDYPGELRNTAPEVIKAVLANLH